ncbi:MAG: hypothetical protein CL840_13250 [Crocinitomicaceae bacterium]|nr:hypothetical protein [Crocinitomicaceae bacterium]|tara:strand:+ start:6447 stop:7484 length:1038 start_codon:yes stop_codon:yes gene_type:complete
MGLQDHRQPFLSLNLVMLSSKAFEDLIFEHSENPMVLLSFDLSVLKTSVSLTKIRRKNENGVASTSFLDLVSDKDKKRINNYLIRVRSTGISGKTDFRSRNSEKQEWLSFNWQRIDYNAEQLLLGIGEYIKPLEQERLKIIENEEALRDSEIIGKMGSWWVNPKTMENHWSEGNYRIWGVDPAKKAPSVDWVLSKLLPEDSLKVYNSIKRVGITGKPTKLKFRMRLNENEPYRFFFTRVRPWYVNGELMEVKGVNFEVTDLVKYQNDLELKNKRLNKSNKALAEFVRMNSHDLRGPLSNILSMLEWDQIEGMDHKEFVKYVKKAATRLDKSLNKINQLLNVRDVY